MQWFSGWRTGRDAPRTYPIAILSFDRPAYLRQVLRSLRRQLSQDDTVILFQDGAWNRHSLRQKANPSAIEACVKLFRQYFPRGQVMKSGENLGIAWNYERAENHVFETLMAKAALFLEDDLVLSPNYLDVIDKLLSFAIADLRVAYVSAYGDFWASRSQQEKNLHQLRHMHENWGAATTRQAWLAERAFRLQYLELVRDIDYSLRDNRRIEKFYADRGWSTRITSQDCARWIACLERGAVRITTASCHAKYIGVRGEHFTPEIYRARGYGNTVWHKGAIGNPEAPNEADIVAWLEKERARFALPGSLLKMHETGRTVS